MKIRFVAHQHDRNAEKREGNVIKFKFKEGSEKGEQNSGKPCSQNNIGKKKKSLLQVSKQIDQFFVQNFADVEALGRVDGVNEDIAVDVDRVLWREDGELVLSSGIHQQHFVLVAMDRQLLVEC